MQTKIVSKSWEAIREGDSVVFKCKVCGFTVRSHQKNYEIGLCEILQHIADNHVNV